MRSHKGRGKRSKNERNMKQALMRDGMQRMAMIAVLHETKGIKSGNMAASSKAAVPEEVLE
jgi:hypothetical protein